MVSHWCLVNGKVANGGRENDRGNLGCSALRIPAPPPCPPLPVTCCKMTPCLWNRWAAAAASAKGGVRTKPRESNCRACGEGVGRAANMRGVYEGGVG